ncbi:MAG: DR2241 family protein [Halobacteria archaeon]|nr:DR2241 family protein [Halobacteria archaeon]
MTYIDDEVLSTAVERARKAEAGEDGIKVPEDDGPVLGFDGEKEEVGRDELRERLSEHPERVADWYYWEVVVRGHGTPRRGFLRWVEDADETEAEERYSMLEEGVTRSWGEVSVEVRLEGDGSRNGWRRSYELRHEDDVETPSEELEKHEKPREAREVAKFDSDGRYRPLKTAPTLRDGWVFEDLDGDGLVEAIDFLYPATVANWHLEREGELDVTHWEDVAERQTGIYESVDELDGEALESAVESFCVDDECIKRREWDETDEEAIGVERGDGVFPCREACSLFVSGAREFVMTEREEEETYELRLTPSELEQIDEIIESAAERRRPREGDVGDGANPHRARYLRSRRFENGIRETVNKKGGET